MEISSTLSNVWFQGFLRPPEPQQPVNTAPEPERPELISHIQGPGLPPEQVYQPQAAPELQQPVNTVPEPERPELVSHIQGPGLPPEQVYQPQAAPELQQPVNTVPEPERPELVSHVQGPGLPPESTSRLREQWTRQLTEYMQGNDKVSQKINYNLYLKNAFSIDYQSLFTFTRHI
ncbi:MAG: hypothetical protein U9O82_14525 [Thermodesulfobacteriota bacterium]|nr:hypothetical protein [Thermodesulfobacteriota bacterium]